MSGPPIYVISLRGTDDRTTIRELGLLLKRLLRGFGLKCVSISEERGK
jgi:hypothetical protein